jgi:hypothetical protein
MDLLVTIQLELADCGNWCGYSFFIVFISLLLYHYDYLKLEDSVLEYDSASVGKQQLMFQCSVVCLSSRVKIFDAVSYSKRMES